MWFAGPGEAERNSITAAWLLNYHSRLYEKKLEIRKSVLRDDPPIGVYSPGYLAGRLIEMVRMARPLASNSC